MTARRNKPWSRVGPGTDWKLAHEDGRETHYHNQKLDMRIRVRHQTWAQHRPVILEWASGSEDFRWVDDAVREAERISQQNPISEQHRMREGHAHPAAYLPVNIGEQSRFEVHGRSFIIGWQSRGVFWLSTDPPGERRRWGNRRQILEDIEHVLDNGSLPPAEGGRW